MVAAGFSVTGDLALGEVLGDEPKFRALTRWRLAPLRRARGDDGGALGRHRYDFTGNVTVARPFITSLAPAETPKSTLSSTHPARSPRETTRAVTVSCSP